MAKGASKIAGGGNVPAPSTNVSNVPQNATMMDDTAADKLRQDMDSSYDANTKAAVKMYISKADFDKDGHSLSQTMNFLMDEGYDLNNANLAQINQKYGLRLTQNDLASMQYTDGYLGVAAHAIGKDTMLQRGAHDDLLKNAFGIADYSKLSQAQLQQQLVGQAFRTTSYMSTSYDFAKNPFLSSSSGSGVSGGREVVYNVKVGSATRVLFGAKNQAEIIVNKGTNFKITDVKYTGNTATPRGKGSRPQIVIDIETI